MGRKMKATAAMVAEWPSQGREQAFRNVVEEHSRHVFRIAFRLTRNEADAEDVVQETFLKAYRQIDTFEQRSRLATWLHRIAVNCAYDFLRKRGRDEKRTVHPSPQEEMAAVERFSSQAPDAHRLLAGSEISRVVESTLDALTAAERSAFILRHFEELPIAEIGERLGLSEAATKHAIFRAVRKMRAALARIQR